MIKYIITLLSARTAACCITIRIRVKWLQRTLHTDTVSLCLCHQCAANPIHNHNAVSVNHSLTITSSHIITLLSRKHFRQCICSSAGNEWLWWMKCNVMNRFVKLLTMRRDFLNTSLAVQIPQTNRTIVAYTHKHTHMKTQLETYRQHSTNTTANCTHNRILNTKTINTISHCNAAALRYKLYAVWLHQFYFRCSLLVVKTKSQHCFSS